MYAFFSSLWVRITTSDRIALHSEHHVPMLPSWSHSFGVKMICVAPSVSKRQRPTFCITNAVLSLPLDIPYCKQSQGFAQYQLWLLA